MSAAAAELEYRAAIMEAISDGLEGDDRVVFYGHGQGHGEGLDVESAKASGLPADRILEQAYGRHRKMPTLEK